VTLFAVAGVLNPIGAADLAAPRTGPSTTDAPLFDPMPRLAAPQPAAPSVNDVLKRRPTHVAKAAPVNHGVISGLAANGIPSVALNAYRVGAARMNNADPSCGINWSLLAGIGREESDHGRFAGAVLHADGLSTPEIIGPALDGVRWDYVPAPANGPALDGDAKFAHALGPMQFIPSTWSLYGTDATGDGRADIFNINDAALSAARYLCAAGGDLRSRSGQVRAVLAYNHSDEYLAQVLALADAYRRGISITGIPVGITTGRLPPVTDTGYIPPANPGAPTAVERTGGHKKKAGAATRRSPTPTPSPVTKRRTSAPAPTATTSKPKPRTSPSPTASKTSVLPPTPAPSPTPSPTQTCGPLDHLLGKC
jgi:hypothetical protein